MFVTKWCMCRLLFELLVMTGAQVGSDWTSVLKKRETFRWDFIYLSFHYIDIYNIYIYTYLVINL